MKHLTLLVVNVMEHLDPHTHGCNEVWTNAGGACVSDTGDCVDGMGEIVCEALELSCDMEVITCPNGDRLEKGDSLVPPTARTLASKARSSDSDMPIAVVNVA